MAAAKVVLHKDSRFTLVLLETFLLKANEGFLLRRQARIILYKPKHRVNEPSVEDSTGGIGDSIAAAHLQSGYPERHLPSAAVCTPPKGSCCAAQGTPRYDARDALSRYCRHSRMADAQWAYSTATRTYFVDSISSSLDQPTTIAL